MHIYFEWIGTRDGWSSERVNHLMNGDLVKVKEGIDCLCHVNADLFNDLYPLENMNEIMFRKYYGGKGGPLYMACKSGNTDLVKLLIEKGADISLKTSSGCYPVHIAASIGGLDIIKILIGNNSPFSLKNDRGETPLDIAKFFGYDEVVDYLRCLDLPVQKPPAHFTIQ